MPHHAEQISQGRSRKVMIDPIESLAFSIQANSGVYALLLGSGISRSAGIPTGWDITLDLVEKLAVLYEEPCEPGPVEWFQEKFKRPPDYSMLLDELTNTRTERQQLLRPYFEADEQEREEGLKQPTAAHHAIAQLAAQGFVRVIITTNFDRLTETALRAAGVEPAVLSSPDDLKGARPLAHIQCCVFKVHGDYLDTRIRNIQDELDKYPEEINSFLDRVLDEFGLVVCGWSATWDGALRDAIRRISSRRFTTFWATRGEPSDEAQRLIENRRAEVIPIEEADFFFQKVQHKVEAIEVFRTPHPLSTEAAVASLKRFLPEPRYRIQLADLIDETVERVVEVTSGNDFDANHPHPTTETVTARIRAYELACSTLIEMAMVGGRWAEEEHCDIWQRALQRLSMVPLAGGKVLWLDMRRYPATLLLYALGLGAVNAGRLDFLGRLFSTTVRRQNNERDSVTQCLAPDLYLDGDAQAMQILEGMSGKNFPLNDWTYRTLRHSTKATIPDDDQYTFIFDKLEILISLNAWHNSPPGISWLRPLGVFMYRYETSWEQILPDIEGSILNQKDESPYVKANLFGLSADHCWRNLFAWYSWLSMSSHPGSSPFSAHPQWGKRDVNSVHFGNIRVGDPNQWQVQT